MGFTWIIRRAEQRQRISQSTKDNSLSHVDLVVYCISMVERFEESAQRALKEFVCLQPDVFQNTIVALTQSNKKHTQKNTIMRKMM